MIVNCTDTTVGTVVEIEHILNSVCTIFKAHNFSNMLFLKCCETESLRTQALNGPLYQPGRRIAGGNGGLQRKPAAVPFSPPQIAREAIWNWTRPDAVTSRQLKA
jgi:hypothetical protein